MNANHRMLAATVAVLLGLAAPRAGAAAFVYEGRLDDRGAPADGRYDIRLTAYPDASRGSTLAAPMTFEAVAVRDGRFRLEFDLPLAHADATWLELGVRDAGATQDFTAIPGRAKATAAPLVGACWSTTGDSGVNPAVNFLGTVDDQPLVVRFNNAERGRFDAGGLRVNGPTFQPQVEFAVRANALSQYSNLLLEAGGTPNRRSGVLLTVGDGIEGQNNQALYIDHYQDEGQSSPSQTRRLALGGNGGGRFAGTDLVASGVDAVAVGGDLGLASGARAATLGGQVAHAAGAGSVVLGGSENCAGGRSSLAAGERAKVRPGSGSSLGGACQGVPTSTSSDGDTGTFVWSDSRFSAPFVSSGSHQFLVRASNGVAVNSAPPDPAVELTLVASPDYFDAPNIFMRQANAATGGILFSVAGATANANNAEFILDQYKVGGPGAGQVRRFIVDNNGGVAFNREDATINAFGDAGALVVGNSAANGNRAYLSNGGTWTNTSSRALKEAFEAVDVREVLRRVLDLPVTTWAYRGSDEGRHMGPVAEDFFAAFGLGDNDRSISTVDGAGVALAAIQGLHHEAESARSAQDAAIAAVRAENDDLRARLARLERRLGIR